MDGEDDVLVVCCLSLLHVQQPYLNETWSTELFIV